MNSRNQNRETYRPKTKEAAPIFQKISFLETFVAAGTQSMPRLVPETKRKRKRLGFLGNKCHSPAIPMPA